jgi:ubiquinone/menaquinone biosynthesis C-methylase UbiE
MRHWMDLPQSVRTGKPATSVNREATGGEFFREFVEDLFPRGYPAARRLAEALEIEKADGPRKVLDLAAGSGVWSIALVESSPHVRATAVDWPEVLPVTRQVTQRRGVADRYRFVEGDLLEVDFGAGYHAAVLGHILHSEGEARSRRLLKKVFDALAPGGAICIAEMVPNQDRTGPAHALIFALNMLVHTDEGDTFTFGEMSRWLTETGFVNPRQLEVPAPSPLILADRPAK